MNGLNDSHKRTSINISQLLNPANSQQSYPTGPTLTSGPPQTHDEQQGLPSFQQPYGLRAASWDRRDDGTERTPDHVPTSSRGYQQSQMNPADVYGDQTSRVARPRVDDSNTFTVDGLGWHPPHEIGNMSYGAPVISPMYSDERTGKFIFFSIHSIITDYQCSSHDRRLSTEQFVISPSANNRIQVIFR
jgi:hypothetical protein